MLITGFLFFFLLILGVPIAFVLLGSSVAYFAMNPMMGSIVAQRLASSLESFPLLAVPFFIFTGAAMARGGIAHRLYDLAEGMVGHWRGGLAQVAVMNSLFLGAMSGSSNADAAIEARTIAPIMRERGYSNAFASVVSASSSVVAPIMPPSIGLIIYGLLTNTSIGKLFIGGVVPALLITISMLMTVRIVSKRRGYGAMREKRLPLTAIMTRTRSALWALAMPVLLLVGLRGGWFTPTELGAIAAVYALIVGLFIYRGFKFSHIYDMLKESAHTTAGVMFIMAAASVFSLILALEQLPQAMLQGLLSLTDNKYLLLLIINIALLLLGTVLEGLALLIILAPLLLEVINNLGIDPVHFGIVMVFNTTIGSVTPPVGTVLYTVCSITKCSIEEFTVEFLPFFLALVLVLLALVFVPPLVTFLPNAFF
ncbi:TRAP transporter large permease [Pseudochrobactrum asaccharolyticum]|uniref:TRAP transporter large permease protein n=1 Tax=Pseudochrobactrum asaccharolyticum TaxID=354351 RepID=A0A366DCT0_9HYPH|nr:TRAP transporter large permease [Pseudochrobactrum asaccharolyticum]RBO87745.1 tripartite ATP-independent transporter DctM subunit [Pseudochrobactrum asaccharolyticum]